MLQRMPTKLGLTVGFMRSEAVATRPLLPEELAALLSDSAESLRSDVGFRLFYQWQIGKVIVNATGQLSFSGVLDQNQGTVVLRYLVTICFARP
jgi:hypothetical protein